MDEEITVKVTIPSILDCVQQKQLREEDLEEKAWEIEIEIDYKR